MNKLLAALLISVSSLSFAADAQKVCIDKIGKDGKAVVGKDGKAQQDCKTMKVHKKLEATPVPVKK